MPETCRDCQQSARHLEDPTARCAKHSPSEIASESWTSNSLSVLSGEANEATKSYHIAEIRRTLAALRTAVADAEGRAAKDTARLDAIERGEVTIECMGTTVPYQWVDGPGGHYCAIKTDVRPMTLREAIDRALAPSSATPSTETGNA